MDLHNASAGNATWNWTNSGPCNASGILSSSQRYQYFDNRSTAIAITPGNVTLVCLNSVGNLADPYAPGTGTTYGGSGSLNATWYYDSTGHLLTHNHYGLTTDMANNSTYSGPTRTVESCNSFTAAPGSPSWKSPWNLTHIDNASFTPCKTYYEMNNNTTLLPSFAGADTVWSPDQKGYVPNDVVYEIPVHFSKRSIDGVYRITVVIEGVTPVEQTFYFNNTVHGTTSQSMGGQVLFVFDETAAWLYDTGYNMSGKPAPPNAPEIYGAVGVASVIVTELPPPRLTVVATVAAGTHPYGVAYDSAKDQVFVTNYGTNNVSVISATTDKVVATVAVGTGPWGLVYDPAKGEVYVTNTVTNNVSVINDSTDKVVATVAVGTGPHGVTYDALKGEAFVANLGTDNLSVINDTSNAVVATIGVGAGPWGLAYDAAHSEVFTTTPATDHLGVINDTTNAITAIVAVGTSPYGVAYDPVQNEVFVANSGSRNVTVVSAATDAVVANIKVGQEPVGVAYDPATKQVFVANSGSRTVSVISDTTNAVVKKVPVGREPMGVAYASVTKEIFVTNFYKNKVSVISETGG